MSLFKLGTIGMIKDAKNNPRSVAISDMKNGYVFKIVDNYNNNGTTVKEAAVPFTDDADAKTAQVWVAINIIDQPELWNYSDFVIKAGKNVNAFALDRFIGYPVELSSDLVVTPASVAKGDYLVPVPSGTNQMLWKEVADPTGYGVALQVVDITNFGGIGTVYGKGFECKIIKR